MQKTILAVLVASTVITLILTAFAAHFRELSDVSALDIAQIARNLATGRGYTTSAPTPLSLSMVPHAEGHPELSRPPLYIALLSLSFRIFGATDRVAALTSTFFLILCAAAVYVLAARLYGRVVGVISVLVLASTPTLLRSAISGTDATFLALLLTTLLLVLAWWRTGTPGRDVAFALAAGAICGLAFLTRQEMLAMLLVSVVFAALHLRRRALVPALVMVGLFCVMSAPWLWRSYKLTGHAVASLSSYDLVMRTSTFPGASLYLRFETPTRHPLAEALREPLPVARKLATGLLDYYEGLPQVGNTYLLAFFIVGVPLAMIGRQHALLHLMVVLAWVLMAIVLSLYGPVSTVMISLVPLTVAFAAGWVRQLVVDAVSSFGSIRIRGGMTPSPGRGTRRRRRVVALAAATLFLMIPLIPFLFRDTPPNRAPLSATIGTVARRPEAVFVSDDPTAVAWYADKVAIPLPESPESLQRMRKAQVGIEAIYLSPAALRFPPSQRVLAWMEWLSQDDSGATLANDEAVSGRLWRLKSI